MGGGREVARWLLWAVAAAFALGRLGWLDAGLEGLSTGHSSTHEGWCPLLDQALRASGAPAGVSPWSTRLPGALAGALTVALAGWALRRRPLAAALAAALVATQPVLFALSREAPREALQLLLVTAAWALAGSGARRPATWLGAGAVAALAVLGEVSALPAVPLVLLAPLLRGDGQGRGALREVAWVAAGLAAVGLLDLSFGLADLDLLRQEIARAGSALGGAPLGLLLPVLVGLRVDAAGHLGSHPGFWLGLLPLVALAGAAAATWLLAGRRSPGGAGARAAEAPARLALAWLALSAGLLMLGRSPPLEERYWMDLLLPLAALTASAVCGAAEVAALGGGALRAGRLRSALAALLLAAGPILAARQVAVLAWPGEFEAQDGRKLAAVMAAAAAVLVAGLLALGLHRMLARAGWAGLALASAVVTLGGGAVAASLTRPALTGSRPVPPVPPVPDIAPPVPDIGQRR